jgi:hypothetical protein
MPIDAKSIPLRVQTSAGSTFSEDFKGLTECQTCKIKITGWNTASPSTIIIENVGIEIDENPKTSFRYRGIEYGLKKTRLIRWGHELDREYDAEIQFEFGAGSTIVQYILCIPLLKGSEGRGTTYFSKVGRSQMRPDISSIIDKNAKFLSYMSGKKTYIVSTSPSYILNDDYERLGFNAPYFADSQKTNKPTITPTNLIGTGISSEFTRIPNIRLENGASMLAVKQAGVSTEQVKCRPIRPDRDIKNNMLYVGGDDIPGDTTLADEMSKSDRYYENPSTYSENTTTVADIERTIGIIVGVVIGVIILGLVAFFVLKWTLNRYPNNKRLDQFAQLLSMNTGKGVLKTS